MRKAQVRALRDQQADGEADRILIGLAQIDEPPSEVVGMFNVSAHRLAYSIDGM